MKVLDYEIPFEPTVTNVAIVGSVVFFVYLLIDHRDGRAIGTRKRPDLRTMPNGIPLLGNMFWMLNHQHELLENYADARLEGARLKDPRPMSFTLPFMRVIDVTNSKWFEYIQKQNFANFGKGSIQANMMRDILGEGIFAVDGDKWTVQRKATSKIFSASNFRGVITESIEQDLDALKGYLRNQAKAGTPFDLCAVFFAFTMNSFTRMAFGKDLHCITEKGINRIPFAVAFDFAQTRIDQRVFEPGYKFTELFTPIGAKMRKARKTIDDFAYGIIDEREKAGDAAPTNDLLTLYRELRDEKGHPLDRKALRDAVVNLIIAGRDTTAQALSWTFYHLMANPKFQEPIKKELDAAATDLDYDNFRDFKETLAAFQEGLRLHPSVPKNLKTVFADDQLPDGPKVYAGEYVAWNDWALAREDKATWGEDADKFRPSRWLKEDGSVRKEDQFTYHVFNAGARLCLGQTLATYEATRVIATILKDFEIEFAPNWETKVDFVGQDQNWEKSPRYMPSLTLPMKDPMMVTVRERKNRN